MEEFWALLVFAALIVVTVAAVYDERLQEQKRWKQWLPVAKSRGFQFFAAEDPALLAKVGHFRLFSQGHARKVTNVLRKNVDAIDVSIFDYRFTTGSGKHSHTHRQTVALLESNQIRLPRFALRPEGVLAKLGSFLGYRDIDFEAHPEFSDAYLLQGEDEAGIREVFTDEVLSYDAWRSDLCIEGDGQQIVYYQANRRIAPEELGPFLRQSLEVVNLFCEQSDPRDDDDLLDRVLEEAQAVLEGGEPGRED